MDGVAESSVSPAHDTSAYLNSNGSVTQLDEMAKGALRVGVCGTGQPISPSHPAATRRHEKENLEKFRKGRSIQLLSPKGTRRKSQMGDSTTFSLRERGLTNEKETSNSSSAEQLLQSEGRLQR